MPAQITLTARLSTSAADARRGVVRLHREVLDALGLRAWDAVRLIGSRTSAALAAPADNVPTGVALVDDVTLSNVGLRADAEVVVEPVEVVHARTVTVDGSRMATTALTQDTLRLALLGKVLTVGDAVSLLPQDLAPPPSADVATARTKLSRAVGITWTSELLTVTATDPGQAVFVGPSSVVHWRGKAPEAAGQVPSAAPTSTTPRAPVVPADAEQPPAVRVSDLAGAHDVADKLAEWFELAFEHPELLAKLGAGAHLGVLFSGPEGVGKATVVRAVAHAAGIDVVTVDAPALAVLEPDAALGRLTAAFDAAAASPSPTVVLLTDVDAALPADDQPPVATVLIDRLRSALTDPRVAVVATTAHPQSVDRRLLAVDLLDRELRISLPSKEIRTDLLRILLREVPVESDVDLGAVAERTPGFVAADLVALRRDAAVRAALRQRGSDHPKIAQHDLLDAVSTVRPISMSESDTLSIGNISLDDVGDMVEVKQTLTEAILWPLRYPDSFDRLGVTPPRGVLLYGPPGGGKTFLVRALAGTGALNVFAVKGAELLDKFVGESERAVRELFQRARDAAPSLVFLDEVDALAPRRGQSSDSGVADRVVATLLTELDGVEALNNVVVLGATNRPELVDPALLRPGRLERLVYVPPPDADARTEILGAAAKNTPLASDVDIATLASELDGYSAADCVALIREGALTAMRESLEATEVTAPHLAQARETVRPSLDPAQLAALEKYAGLRRAE